MDLAPEGRNHRRKANVTEGVPDVVMADDISLLALDGALQVCQSRLRSDVGPESGGIGQERRVNDRSDGDCHRLRYRAVDDTAQPQRPRPAAGLTNGFPPRSGRTIFAGTNPGLYCAQNVGTLAPSQRAIVQTVGSGRLASFGFQEAVYPQQIFVVDDWSDAWLGPGRELERPFSSRFRMVRSPFPTTVADRQAPSPPEELGGSDAVMGSIVGWGPPGKSIRVI